MTPYHRLLIPPPLSHFQIKLDTYPNAICHSRNAMFTILDNGHLTVYDYEYSDKITKHSTKESLFDDNLSQVLKFNAVRIEKNDFIVAYVVTSFNESCLQNQKKLFILDISLADGTINVDSKKEFIVYGEDNNPPALCVGTFEAENNAHIKLIFTSNNRLHFLYNDNSIKVYSPNSSDLVSAGNLKTDLNVIDLECYNPITSSNKKKASMALSELEDNNSYVSDDNTEVINYFGLTNEDKLLHNGALVVNDCTSYCIADNKFLLFTTLNQGMYDLLHTYTLEEINKGQAAILLTSQIPKNTDGKSHYIRNVERGSRIVVCADNRLIFQ